MEGLKKNIWKRWKNSWTLYRIARYVAQTTGWSEYISLAFVIDFLHNEKGIGFSRRQLRYAFSHIPEDEIHPEDRTDAWKHILAIGGYMFKRGGRRTPDERECVLSNTSMLSSLNPETASEKV